MTASIRNYEKEFNEMIDFLALKNTNQMSFLDLGCGTGASLVYAAKHFQKVYGVDVSKSMLEQAQKKIEKEKITNASLIQSGFLTYTHQEEPVDLVMTKAAFHHLPDFWKQIALLKMNQMLKKNGLLYLFDVVFHLDPKDYQMKINQWVSGFEKLAGKKMKEEVEIHIRDEYSTFSWILNGMIENAGFKIEKSRTNDGFITEYHCVKIQDLDGFK